MPAGLNTGLGPWILAAFGVALVIAAIATVRAVRESRFSPYYLLRRQASERMRARFILTFALLVVLIGLTVVLAARPPLEIRLPAVVLTFPFLTSPTPLARATEPAAPTGTPAATRAPTLTPSLMAPPTRANVHTPPPSATPTRALPQGFLTPVAPYSTAAPGAAFGALILASNILTESAYPLVPTDTFRTGHFTIYGVFTYTHMTPGVAWTHVWLRGTTPVRGETALWSLVPSGRAFVFVNPAEGWLPGAYEVDLYIEDRLQQVARFRVIP